ncbi:peptidase M24, structural domain-containing protein [Phlyctochytrium arcticum]|nr:peptidase M24, structural domain-containing protein [Phlyctochytrium arcticum]
MSTHSFLRRSRQSSLYFATNTYPSQGQSSSSRQHAVRSASFFANHFNFLPSPSRIVPFTSRRTLSIPTSYKLGQPCPDTHPHLIKPGEVTPGLTAQEYHSRRLRLVQSLPENAVAIVPGYGLRYSSQKIFYPFHQQTNMLYLTGVDEPDCALILYKTSEIERGYKMTLFVRPKDKKNELWDGPRAGFEGAIGYFGADEAKPISSFSTVVDGLLSSPPGPLFSDLPLNSSPSPYDATHLPISSSIRSQSPPSSKPDPSISSFFKNLSPLKPPRSSSRPTQVRKLNHHIAALRVRKSPAEISLLRQAGRITGRAFEAMMRETAAGVGEADIAAVAEYVVKRKGASGLAYVPVVAGGKNALTIHYVVNNQILKEDSLILVDAGAEYAGYASDITRTWPVNPTFSKPQRDLYEAVLRVQKAAIAKCTGDQSVSLDDLQRLTTDLLSNECSKLLKRPIGHQELSVLWPHHVGHYLGMDLHDTECISRSKTLESGMVITIEPGLYIPDTDLYPPELRGTGIRIEDDVVMGSRETGYSPIVLSVDAPKEVADIEAVRGGLVRKGVI